MRYSNYAIALLIFSSCATVYVPSTAPVPFLSECGEASFIGTLGNGAELSATYAFTDHMGIFAQGGLGRYGKNNDTSQYHQRQYGELALGYFHTGYNLYVDAYLGVGLGKSQGESYELLSRDRISANGRYRKYFMQSSMGRNNGLFNGAFTQRLSVVDFYNLNGVLGNLKDYKPSTGIFYEPSVTSKISISSNNKIHLITNFGLSIPLNDKKIFFDRRVYYFSFGALMRIN